MRAGDTNGATGRGAHDCAGAVVPRGFCSECGRHTPRLALWGLLHDAAEAYLADIPRPVKPFIPGWREIERRVMRAVCARFGLPEAEPVEVKDADWRVLADEKAVLMADGPVWADIGAPLGVAIHCQPPAEARGAFLDRFFALQPE